MSGGRRERWGAGGGSRPRNAEAASLEPSEIRTFVASLSAVDREASAAGRGVQEISGRPLVLLEVALDALVQQAKEKGGRGSDAAKVVREVLLPVVAEASFGETEGGRPLLVDVVGGRIVAASSDG